MEYLTTFFKKQNELNDIKVFFLMTLATKNLDKDDRNFMEKDMSQIKTCQGFNTLLKYWKENGSDQIKVAVFSEKFTLNCSGSSNDSYLDTYKSRDII